jgi:hypothetical protein
VITVGDNMDAIKKKAEPLIHASKEVGLGVNRENYVYFAVSLPECRAKS